MSFRKSIYFKLSVPVALAPIFAFLAIAVVERFGAPMIGEWSSKLTFVPGLISAPIFLVISKFRDLCSIDGLTDFQRANLVSIVSKRTFRFWMAFLYSIAVFLAGFSISAVAGTDFGYLMAVGWIVAFLFTLYILAITHFWLDEAEEFKMRVAKQLRDEKERTDLIHALHKTQSDKVDKKPELEGYNKVFDPKSGVIK